MGSCRKTVIFTFFLVFCHLIFTIEINISLSLIRNVRKQQILISALICPYSSEEIEEDLYCL